MDTTRAPFIAIQAIVTSETTAKIESIHPHQQAPKPRTTEKDFDPTSSALPLMVEMVDEDGNIVLRHPVYAMNICMHPTPEPHVLHPVIYSVSGLVPLPAEAVKLRLVNGVHTMATRSIPRAGPVVQLKWMTPPATHPGIKSVEWEAKHPEGCEMQHSVCYIIPGEEWRPFHIAGAQTTAKIHFNELPGGKLAIGIMSTDGFYVSYTPSDYFQLPEKPCKPLVVSPANGSRFTAGSSIPLSGTAYYPGTGKEEKAFLHWETASGEPLGCGKDIEISLPPGDHEIKLIAGRSGFEGEAVTHVIVI